MTRIKICGITCLDDALAAIDAGADALGFVFAPSPRRVDARTAGAIVTQLPPFVQTIGVTVDAKPREIEEIVRLTRVDVLQFHGNESLQRCLGQTRPVLKRIPVLPGDDARMLRERTEAYHGVRLLVDPGYGDGRPFRFELAAGIPQPLVLAGGLDPDIVAHAIRQVRPYGIDVCSGVESAPGKKDPVRMRALVRAVRSEDARHAA